jgi:uncharacterized membrane protein
MNLKLKILYGRVYQTYLWSHRQFRKTRPYKNLLTLLLWMVIGTSLRLTQLAAKPPWTDEFSTLVFSLGNSFRVVPLSEAISLDVLLQPLQPNLKAGITQVVQHLLTESNHPPLYFMLAHWWMQLWSPDSIGLASVWAARSLSALLGVASIPAVYGVSWLAFRSRLVSQLAAAIMAVSPYGIFLAQEARHYTLAILWVIASLSCLVIATRHIQQRTPLPIWVGASWLVINFLGISTHYFFSLTLGAEALVLIVLRWRRPSPFSPWWQIYVVAVGTIIGGLVWLPIFLQNSYGGELTEWIQTSSKSEWAWLSPIFQSIAAWITMLSLLPVEASALPVVIASGAVMTVFFLWALPILSRGFKIQLQQPATRLMTQLFAGVVCSAIALFFVFTYALGIDITRGARYNFVYFPAVIVLVGASLAVCWKTPVQRQNFLSAGKTAVTLIWLMGLLSGLTVVGNLGYQKYYRPDLLVQLIQKVSQSPVLIATTHKTHVQTGEMMGIAREIKLSGSPATPQFLLAHQDQNPYTATAALQKTLKAMPRPFDLWLVNFYAPAKITNCFADPQPLQPVDGYNYRLYHCK